MPPAPEFRICGITRPAIFGLDLDTYVDSVAVTAQGRITRAAG